MKNTAFKKRQQGMTLVEIMIALVLGALTGIDEKDSYSLKSVGNSFTDYTPFLKAKGKIVVF